ncbi:UvrD-helicase domain-containing protein [Porticoccus sp.]
MSIVDAPQRALALDPNRSFAVSAPAGSGKTELLTQRVLRLLATVDRPEEILCMTFTRKAAGEMRHRIIQALQRASRHEPPEGEHQRTTFELASAALARDSAQGWQLLQAPNRLRILTIDGFCLNLARQLALESGFGEQMEPLDNPEPHYRQVIADLLLPALEQQSPLGAAIATLLGHLDNDLNKLEALLLELLPKREQWLGHLFQTRSGRDYDAREYLESFLRTTVAETLAAAAVLLKPYSSELALLADYAASQLPEDKQHLPIAHCLGIRGLPDTDAGGIDQWLGLCELLMTRESEWRARLDKNLGFPTEVAGDKARAKAQKEAMTALLRQLREIPGLHDRLEDIRFLPNSTYPDNQWQALNALSQLLPTLAAALSLHFQQYKVCDFTEITLAALRALGDEEEPTELALKLDYQLRHILTDEFQDTSSAQFAILKRLTAGWQPGDGHSLFIVGDAMQSLYGFRSANVGLFLEARTLPIGQIQLEPLDLQVNFRSQAGLIRWVNERFPAVFPTAQSIGRGAVPYSPATAFHEAQPDCAVTLDAFVDFPDRRAEAARVVALVTDAKTRQPDGSIAILVRNRTHLPEILRALQQAGHRWQATDIDPLGKRMPVIDLMSLTRALLSPADRIAWLAVLRAPWCGLDLEDLLCLSISSPGNSSPDEKEAPARRGLPLLLEQLALSSELPELSPAGKKILQRVAPLLVRAWQQRQRKPLRCWVEGTWQALGGTATLRSNTELEQCRQYLALLEQHEQGGTIADWKTFEKAVQKLYAKPDQAADTRLQVMTIHKAKGLEFDTVIIPGLNRQPRGDDTQLLLWQERISESGETQLLIGPPAQTGNETDALYRHLAREHKLKNRLEIARVLYVGVTRAIRQLHLLCTVKDGKPPVRNSLLDSLWPALEQDFAQRAESIRWHKYVEEDSGADQSIPQLASIKRLPLDWQPVAGMANLSLAREQQNEGRPSQQGSVPASAEQAPGARQTGTVLHRILRQIAVEGIANWSEGTILQRLPFWDIQLRQLGLSDTAEPLQQLQQGVRNCLADQTANWILDNSHPHSACEQAIGYRDATGQPRTAVIDRTFVDQGVRWVIDYKTAQPDAGEPLQQFLQRQREHYREQLDCYAQLYRQLGDHPVKIALYFPLIHRIDIL